MVKKITLAFVAVSHLVALVAAGFGAGYFLDRRLASTPWLTLLLSCVGMGLGFYRLYKAVENEK